MDSVNSKTKLFVTLFETNVRYGRCLGGVSILAFHWRCTAIESNISHFYTYLYKDKVIQITYKISFSSPGSSLTRPLSTIITHVLYCQLYFQ